MLFWAFGALVLVFSIVPVLHSIRGHSIKDYELWYQTAQLAMQGRGIYPDRFHKFDFMYPPPCALFLAPFSLLGQTGLIVALVIVNSAAWIASILLSVRLTSPGRDRPHVLLYAVPTGIVVIYVWGNFLLGQPTLPLLALMLGAFLALQHKAQFTAGALIAAAAAIKAFPVIAILYLLYRRYWIAVGSLTLVLAFLLLALPTLVRGYPQARADLRRWSDGMLLKYDEHGLAQRAGRSNAWKNQSIFGVANRLLRHVDYDDKYEPHTPVYANLANVKFSTVNGLIAAAALAAGLWYIGVMPRRSRRTRETDAVEFALLLLLMLVFTPLAFGYLFAWLLYPFTVITQRLLNHRSTPLLLSAGAAVVLLALTIPWRITAQTYGNVFFATLLLFLGLAVELMRMRRHASIARDAKPEALPI